MAPAVRLSVCVFGFLLMVTGIAFGQEEPERQKELDFILLVAAAEGNYFAADSLLSEGADVNATTWNGVTPLMYAAQNGDLELLNLLVAKGADIHARPANGIDALLSAVIAGYAYVADTLILKGADVNTTAQDRITALMHAAYYGDFTITDMLIFYGADIRLRDNQGNTALMYAVAGGSELTTSLLLEAGAEADAVDNNRFTPLMLAVQTGNNLMALRLLDAGADVNARNEKSLTPLAIAIVYGYDDLAELLISRGANTDMTFRGMNYYDLSRRHGSRQTTQILKKTGLESDHRPHFSRFTLSVPQYFNTKDYLTGLQLGFSDPLRTIALKGGYVTRPWARSLHTEEDGNKRFQYWEYRSAVTLGAEKSWSIGHPSPGRNFGLIAALNGALSFGSYRGSAKTPATLFRIVPEAGIGYCMNRICLQLRYAFFDLHNSRIPAHRINFTTGFRFSSKKDRIELKRMPSLL